MCWKKWKGLKFNSKSKYSSWANYMILTTDGKTVFLLTWCLFLVSLWKPKSIPRLTLCVGNSSVFNMLWHSTDWIQLPLAFVVLTPLESVFSWYSERKNVSVSVQKYIRACDFIPIYPRLTAPESTNEIERTVVTHCFIEKPQWRGWD